MDRKFGWAAGAMMLALAGVPVGVRAQEGQGKWQVKLLGTAVLPDGKIKSVENNAAGIPAATQSKANDNVVPTLAVEYFLTPNVSVETICCLTQHDVDGRGALPGTELVADAKILPATVTLKYHLPLGAIKPYVGAGPTYFIFIDEKSGATTKALGLPRARLNDKVGAVVQAGVDVALGTGGFGLSLDAKRYFVRPTAHWFTAAGTEVLETRHKLDPWVLSAGVSYRF
ncbi:outer membrane protein [Sphingobium jiangsuense]|uniref:Outer membrane protein n=1 Tax=Sphingobium jiangsuense TaxID=870476 RepID=A0A7W6FQ91_9SPHN|nr:outer membrane protein [Sphingobium jiangsuense]GLT00642.1 outer membrane protein [Sphingobium jiangsuense]